MHRACTPKIRTHTDLASVQKTFTALQKAAPVAVALLRFGLAGLDGRSARLNTAFLRPTGSTLTFRSAGAEPVFPKMPIYPILPLDNYHPL